MELPAFASFGPAWYACPKVEGVPHGVRIREAVREDGRELLRLWRELMDLHQDMDPRFSLAERADDRFLAYIDLARAREDYQVFVAEGSGALVGFVVACILPNSPVYRARWIGYINDLSVTLAWRRYGVGRRLVVAALDWLRARGAESIEVYVAHRNEDALRFWRRMGGQEYLRRLTLGPVESDLE